MALESELRQTTRTLHTEATASWKEALEATLKATLQHSINEFKDELLETLSTTKGELLSHLDTLRADMTTYEHDFHIRTQQAETIYAKLHEQHGAMEQLQLNMEQQILRSQQYSQAFHTAAHQFQICTPVQLYVTW
jgi:hypothetical protein